MNNLRALEVMSGLAPRALVRQLLEYRGGVRATGDGASPVPCNGVPTQCHRFPRLLPQLLARMGCAQGLGRLGGAARRRAPGGGDRSAPGRAAEARDLCPPLAARRAGARRVRGEQRGLRAPARMHGTRRLVCCDRTVAHPTAAWCVIVEAATGSCSTLIRIDAGALM